jgi:hypothetical protein
LKIRERMKVLLLVPAKLALLGSQNKKIEQSEMF